MVSLSNFCHPEKINSLESQLSFPNSSDHLQSTPPFERIASDHLQSVGSTFQRNKKATSQGNRESPFVSPSPFPPLSDNEFSPQLKEEHLPLIHSSVSLNSPSSTLNDQQGFDPTNQRFVHHLFEHLRQQKRLRYQDGKAIVTLNGETIIAQLNEHNQWQYISGTLSQETLTKVKSFLKSSDSQSSSQSQSSPLQF